ncbi:MAG: PAS domain S-box protein [Proteobacteria bacterium]|nr:PAS domain S-box protein [Pseudomonadota bacterium]
MASEKHTEAFLRKFSIWCLFITASISILSFAGWILESARLTIISQNYKPCPITTLCLCILSISYIFHLKNPENRLKQIIIVTCAFLVIIISFFSGIRLDAKYLIFIYQNFLLGDMPPVIAANLIIVSTGILFLAFPSQKRQLYNNLAAFCAISSILTELILLLAYLYKTPFLYRQDPIPIPIIGAISLVFLGMGLFTAAGPQTLPVRLFTGISLRNRLLMTFFPLIIAAVFINDILIRLLASFVRVNPAFARSIIAIASAAIVSIVIAKLTKSIGTQLDSIHSKLVKKHDELIKTNKLIEMIAENINEGFWVLDAKVENIIYASPGFKRIRGKSLDVYVENPQSYFDNVHPEDMARIVSAADIYKTGMPLDIAFRIINPDGSIRWVEAHGFPVKDASGKVINNVGIIKDITKQKQAEENLKSERDFSDAALNSLPGLFYLYDNTGRFLRWNKNAETVAGYSFEEIEKMHPLDLCIDQEKALVSETIAKVFKDGHAEIVANLLSKSGKTIPHYLTAKLFQFKATPCVIGIGIDISERKRNALALQKEKETAQKYLDIAGVILIAVNLDIELILANKKACEIFGYEENELIGQNAIDTFIPEDKRYETEIFIKQLLAGEIDISKAKNLQGVILTKKGEQRVIEWSDVLLKDETGKVTGILTSGEDVTERIKMQDMLIQAKNEWEETFDTINDAITIHDDNCNIIRANKTALNLLGISFYDISKYKCFQLYHGYANLQPDCPCCNVLKTEKIAVKKIFEPHLGKHLEVKAIPRFDKNNQTTGIVHVVRDISDQVTAEKKQQLLQSQFLHMQKMESIGRLAGGVAHDFNNILSGILGFSELALLDIAENDPLKERIELIMGLGEKAGSLTKQLLAFSRKQMLEISDTDLNTVVTDMIKMLERIIGEDITLNLKFSETTSKALCDQSQMEQILLNLSVNSRDAMPNGGILTIETDEVVMSDINIINLEEVKPGKYVKLTISDTGCGMSNEVLENIFEPFYTTKEIGKGTGLGLATVYGIIKQHNGYIDVTSKPNQGSAFNLYLPVSNHKEIKKDSEIDTTPIKGGKETILIVDDEPILLSIIENALNPLGYQLLVASTAKEALRINETYDGTIDLLLTDIIMPEINGKDLANMIASVRPGIEVVFMSGYPSEAVADQNLSKGYGFHLQKPLRITMIRQKLREVLDNKHGAS